MATFKNNLLFWFFIFGLFNLCAQDSLLLSLNSAVELALQKNSNLIISKYQSKSSQLLLAQAKGNILPKVFLNAQYNRNIDQQVLFFSETNSNIKLGSDNYYSSTLNISVPIFSNSNFNNKKLANSLVKYQNELERGVKLTLINNLKKSYFNYLIFLEIEKVQEKQLNNAIEILKDIEKRLDRGVVTEFELASAQVQVAIAKNNLLEVQSNRLPAENSLKSLVGLNFSDKIKLTEPIELLSSELVITNKIDQISAQNSTLKQLDLDIVVNKHKIDLVKSEYFPTIEAIGNYNFQTQSNNFNVFNYNWVNTSLVGLQLHLSIFNGNNTKNKIEDAIIKKNIAEEEKKYFTNEIQMQFNQLIAQLHFSKQKIEVQKENMQLTLQAFQLAKKRFQLGVGTFLEISNSELQFTQSKLNWLKAIFNYKSAYYNYKLLIGEE